MNDRCVVLDIGGVLEITPATGWDRAWEERLGQRPSAGRPGEERAWSC
jgi:hypothetical protein